MFYRLTIIGRLGDDMEVHQGKKGKKFMAFSVAPLGTQDVWVNVTQNIEGDQAPEFLQKNLKKGKLVACEGMPFVRVYQQAGKEPQGKQCMFADEIKILG